MEAAFCAIAMDRGFMPGSANIEELDDAAKGFNILRKSSPEALKRVMSLSSGFGGANVALLFEKF